MFTIIASHSKAIKNYFSHARKIYIWKMSGYEKQNTADLLHAKTEIGENEDRLLTLTSCTLS